MKLLDFVFLKSGYQQWALAKYHWSCTSVIDFSKLKFSGGVNMKDNRDRNLLITKWTKTEMAENSNNFVDEKLINCLKYNVYHINSWVHKYKIMKF